MSSEWIQCRLGDAITFKRGYDLPRQSREQGNVPIVSSSGISDYHSVAMVKAPGVVAGRYGTRGNVYYLTEDCLPLNATLYVKDFNGDDPGFISYHLRTIDFNSCSGKAVVPGVNPNHLQELETLIPPIAEQKASAHILGTLDEKIELNRKTNETLEAIAKALFKSWFVDFDPVRGWQKAAPLDCQQKSATCSQTHRTHRQWADRIRTHRFQAGDPHGSSALSTPTPEPGRFSEHHRIGAAPTGEPQCAWSAGIEPQRPPLDEPGIAHHLSGWEPAGRHPSQGDAGTQP